MNKLYKNILCLTFLYFIQHKLLGLLQSRKNSEGFSEIQRKDDRFNKISESRVFKMCNLMIFCNWQSYKGKYRVRIKFSKVICVL